MHAVDYICKYDPALLHTMFVNVLILFNNIEYKHNKSNVLLNWKESDDKLIS